MQRKNSILCIVGIISVIIIGTLFITNPFKEEIWNINADNLRNSFNIISGDADIEDLSQFTPYEWDVLYSFAPYTPKEKIYETIGYKWDNITESVSEGMNQIVFVKDGKVVCYLYGYPENIKLGFNFGEYKGSYIKLTSEQNLFFKTTVFDNGVRYFNYIK
ncbi:hypothetical protein [Alkaliphilus hydrothermalis]|uniref:Lipoprotein n=1 Tax=Alkaliphilus hydrothermalis TaxID=1482730 RepID=A0ABS2NRL3_9FIRM|nr:hypothetical protein [Alkaliphilus hydrothermalis]MBM7615568.1 hypothetical protein [Alkaliphilus hydrothermalis]